MTKHKLLAALLSGAMVAAAPGFAATAAPSGVTEDVAALRAQVQALLERVNQLEAAQQAQAQATQAATEAQQTVNNDVQSALDLQSDNLARTSANVGEWVGRFQWKGDLRFRNEMIDTEFVARDRIRNRIRARAGFVAKVNDTIRAELQLATGGSDPRSSNQTLTDSNSRKPLDLDLAYAEWQATPALKVTVGKMKYPWVRAGQSLFFDGDVNPEGLAVSYQGVNPGGFYASAFYNDITERGTAADSNMIGAQFGWRSNPALATRWMFGVSHFAHGATKGYNPFVSNTLLTGGANGNTTTTSAAVCRRGITTCLANDYNITELFGEFATTLANRPFAAFIDVAQNGDAALDTAYSAGFQYGRASNPQTWELGLQYQKIEKDALFGQYLDSDFADGNTDGDGFVLRFGYAFARNFRLNATYFHNQTNNDVPVTISGVGAVRDRDYQRLQLDINYGF